MATPRRRWLQFSLRGLLALLTVLAIWLGLAVKRAREQREAVKAIEAAGGAVIYGWQHPAWQNNRSHETLVTSNSAESGLRAWVQRHMGFDPFEEVTEVSFSTSPAITDSDIVKSIPHLQRMRGLRHVTVFSTVSRETRKELKFALPNCQVLLYVATSGPNSHRTGPIK